MKFTKPNKFRISGEYTQLYCREEEMARYLCQDLIDFNRRYPGFTRIPIGDEDDDRFLLRGEEVDDFIDGNTEHYEIPIAKTKMESVGAEKPLFSPTQHIMQPIFNVQTKITKGLTSGRTVADFNPSERWKVSHMENLRMKLSRQCRMKTKVMIGLSQEIAGVIHNPSEQNGIQLSSNTLSVHSYRNYPLIKKMYKAKYY